VENFTEQEHEALRRLVEVGLTDKRRLETLVQLIDAASAWGVMRRFLLQVAAATGALSVCAAAILWFRDWMTK